MLKRKMKKVIALAVVIGMVSGNAVAFANNKEARKINTDNFVIEKISNPTTLEGEADGLVDGGDRNNGYAWAMAELGDYIYIGSNRNLIYPVFTNVFGDNDLAKLAAEVIFKGDIPTDDTDYAGQIVRYNKATKTMEPVYKSEVAPNGDYYEGAYRSALKFKPSGEDKESVYIGSYGKQYTRILKFDSDYNPETDKPEVVFMEDSGSTSIRATTIHEDKMYIGSMIRGKDLRILESDNPSVDNWKVVADMNDFKNIPNLEGETAGAMGVFDIISYNGYLYAIVAAGDQANEKDNGFLMFKGKEVGVGAEGANAAGWKWDMVVGPGAKYPSGMGIGAHSVATPFKYTDKDGKEYVYVGTFSDIYLSIFAALKFDFGTMYNTVNNPTELYRFNENDEWEMVVGTPTENEVLKSSLGNYKAGFKDLSDESNESTNQYVWRMAQYNGRLFAGTFDAKSLYDPFVPDKIEGATSEYDEMIKTLLAYADIVNQKDGQNAKVAKVSEGGNNTDDEKVTEALVKLLEENSVSTMSEDSEVQNSETAKLFAQYSTGKEQEPSEYVESTIDGLQQKFTEEMLDKIKPIITEEQKAKGEEILNSVDLEAYKAYFTDDVIEAINTVIKENPNVDNLKLEDYLEIIYEKLAEKLGTDVANKIKEIIQSTVKFNEQLEAFIKQLIEYIQSGEVQKQYEYIKKLQNAFEKEHSGFDLFQSEDGINFSPVSRDGLEDKYNFGTRTFVSSEDGLFVGTANPFYGAQLWKLNEKSTKLQALTLNFGGIALDFDKDVYEYNIDVPNDVDKITINAEADASSTLDYPAETLLQVGKNVIKIKVSNVDGESKEYTINVTRAKATDDNNNNNDNNTDNGGNNTGGNNSTTGGNAANNNTNNAGHSNNSVNNNSVINLSTKNQKLPHTGGENAAVILTIGVSLVAAGRNALKRKK